MLGALCIKTILLILQSNFCEGANFVFVYASAFLFTYKKNSKSTEIVYKIIKTISEEKRKADKRCSFGGVGLKTKKCVFVFTPHIPVNTTCCP